MKYIDLINGGCVLLREMERKKVVRGERKNGAEWLKRVLNLFCKRVFGIIIKDGFALSAIIKFIV